MKIAVLSDIHSNAFALREVLKEVESRGLDEIWLLGDIFGYYPWAADTFELLQPFQNNARTILGNHDLLLLRGKAHEVWQAFADCHGRQLRTARLVD